MELNLGEYFEIIIGPRLKARLSIKHNAKKKKKKKGPTIPTASKKSVKNNHKNYFPSQNQEAKEFSRQWQG